MGVGPQVAVDVCEWQDALPRAGAAPLDNAARATLSDAYAKLTNRSGPINAVSPEPSLDAELERLTRIAERLAGDGLLSFCSAGAGSAFTNTHGGLHIQGDGSVITALTTSWGLPVTWTLRAEVFRRDGSDGGSAEG